MFLLYEIHRDIPIVTCIEHARKTMHDSFMHHCGMQGRMLTTEMSVTNEVGALCLFNILEFGDMRVRVPAAAGQGGVGQG